MENCKTILIALLFFTSSLVAQNRPVLFPQPAQVNYTAGVNALSLQHLTIYLPANAPKNISFAFNELKQVIEERAGKTISFVSSPTLAKIRYTIKSKGPELPVLADTIHTNQREAYSLSITANVLKIDANTSAGLYYAIQTIRQLIKGQGDAAVLPVVTIKDNPVLPFRGVMMDFAHGGLLTVAEIKKQIDFLARYKANQYYFYNEVSIKMEGYPTLNYGANYTKEDIKNIIATKGITSTCLSFP